MVTSRSVDRYSAFLYPDDRDNEARINLYCDGGYKLYVLFRRAGKPLGTNSYNADKTTGVAYEGIDGFARYLDLIRNDRPIWANFNPDVSPPSFVVYANREPVGEEESVSV